MKFKNLLKLTPVLFAIVLLGIPDPVSITHSTKTHTNHTTHITNGVGLFFIISDRNGKSIEKVFINKTNALKYIDTYKENHNYSVEEVILID